jgi:hypothetical protein
MAPKKGSKRTAKVLAPLDFSKITVAKVAPGAEMAAHRPTRGERDAEQRQIDALVKAGWEAWDELDRPDSWEDQPGTYLSVPDAVVETVKTRVTRAGQFYKMSIRFGRIESTDGYSTVVFVVTDAKKRDKNDESADDDSPEE